eukprot:m.17116 g.17116  ORF g.17116 m.17116 type:complete len:108 (-) comp11147_c0_seq3:2602-2925(-)
MSTDEVSRPTQRSTLRMSGTQIANISLVVASEIADTWPWRAQVKYKQVASASVVVGKHGVKNSCCCPSDVATVLLPLFGKAWSWMLAGAGKTGVVVATKLFQRAVLL